MLARIAAVELAGNCPQHPNASPRPYLGRNAKIEYATKRLVDLASAGQKTILFASHPQTLEAIGRQLRAHGHNPVIIHGGIPIAQRTKEMDDRFRFGDATEMLATFGTTQAGLNIPQANRAILLNRDWLAKTERQAIGRMLRPQQRREVHVEYLHHPGSIDCYQAQMVAMKSAAADAGLDWGTPQEQGLEFLHLDTLLGRFVEDLGKLLGVKRHEVRDALSNSELCDAL